MERKIDNYAILIPSCDKYSDIWPYFFKLFFECWDGKLPNIYLLSNFKDFHDPRVSTLKIGVEKSWSDNMLHALAYINESHVLVILEDFLFLTKVDLSLLTELFDFMKSKKAGYLRLMANPPPNTACHENANVGYISKGQNYRTSLQMAFWNVETLKNILVSGESPWDFELKGSKRSNALQETFMSITKQAKQPIEYFPNAIVRGLWVKDAVSFLQAKGITVSNDRKQETILQQWLRVNMLRTVLSNVLFQPVRAVYSYLMERKQLKSTGY